MAKNENEYPPQESFTKKYEEARGIKKHLVDNFYKAIETIAPKEVSSVLEVGCGAGYSTEYLVPLFRRSSYAASDVDPTLVAMAKKMNPNIPFSTESIYDLPQKNKSVDLIIALEILEHLDDPATALKELARVTKQYAIISVPREPLWRMLNMARGAYLGDLGNTPGHINHWSTRGFVRFVETEFVVQKVKTPFPWTVILATKK